MEQAINELGPLHGQDPGRRRLLAGAARHQPGPPRGRPGHPRQGRPEGPERAIRVARFLIQAEWYAEARAELDRILKDFPDDADLRERVAGARASVVQLEAAQTQGRDRPSAGARSSPARRRRPARRRSRPRTSPPTCSSRSAKLRRDRRRPGGRRQGASADDLKAARPTGSRAGPADGLEEAAARSPPGARRGPRRRPRPVRRLAEGQGRGRQAATTSAVRPGDVGLRRRGRRGGRRPGDGRDPLGGPRPGPRLPRVAATPRPATEPARRELEAVAARRAPAAPASIKKLDTVTRLALADAPAAARRRRDAGGRRAEDPPGPRRRERRADRVRRHPPARVPPAAELPGGRRPPRRRGARRRRSPGGRPRPRGGATS